PMLRNAARSLDSARALVLCRSNVADYSVRFSFLNPTAVDADARLTLLRPGAPIAQIIDVPANGRADFTVNDILADETTLPAVVESSAPILVERAMNLTTDIDGGPGIEQLARSWYFAEGSTAGDRRTFLVLFNPQTSDVPATVTYMGSDGAAFTQDVQVPAGQRLVISVYDILPNRDFGMRVIAAQPIAVERTMRFGAPTRGRSPGLHTGRGIQTLARRWYFAEGTTQAPFEMELMVLNPNEQPANATVTLLGPDGTSETRRYAIAPRAQLAINVNDVVPDLGVSTVVEADRPVAVERALYFNNGAAGTIGIGATAPAYTWRFVEGRTSGANYFLLFSNPQQTRAVVTVDFIFGDGARATQRVEVPPQSRYTLAVHDIFPDEGAISATVRSSQAIIVERSLFPTGPAAAARP
ncbi:N-acetylmuramoyl-L-alanine amidase, partial [Candidatus Gracilibacteria bacterium]|nr:N-acetylmuramoyl-L-alanine amidase [Candidatus Gracilibacteria bacterium]